MPPTRPYVISPEPLVTPHEASQLLAVLKAREGKFCGGVPDRYEIGHGGIAIALQGVEPRGPLLRESNGIANPMLNLIMNSRHFDMDGAFSRMFRDYDIDELHRVISHSDLSTLRKVFGAIVARNSHAFDGMNPHGFQALRLHEECFSFEDGEESCEIRSYTFPQERSGSYFWVYIPLDQSWTVRRGTELLHVSHLHAFIPQRNDVMCFDQTQVSTDGLCRTCLIFDPYHGV